jgi:hypothetical protein
MSKLAKALSGAAGNAAGDPLYVEDVFSTYLYDGTGAVKTITNGIDLDGEGGVVWIKQRSGTEKHVLAYDENKYLSSNTTDAVTTNVNYVQSFNSNGFQVGVAGPVNTNGSTYVSWSFRKAEKFFDVVTYTGDGVSGRTVAHSLGSAPAVMFIKCTSAAGDDWAVYHSALGATKLIALNTTAQSLTNPWLTDTAPTDTVFTLNNYGFINASAQTYVAYLFASDAGGYGDDGDESIIKCGSYTGTGTAGLAVAVGFEPQFVMFKAAVGTTSNWTILDSMRGIVTGGEDRQLYANSSGGEGGGIGIELTANGFNVMDTSGAYNTNGATYIYIAIRRGPMKTPTAATEVFAVSQGASGVSEPGIRNSPAFPVDFAILTNPTANGYNRTTGSRLTSAQTLNADTANSYANSPPFVFDYMNGFYADALTTDWYGYSWGRAPGFMDVVAYTGDGASARAVQHSLGVVPEFYVVKVRDAAYDWQTYSATMGNNYSLRFNQAHGIDVLGTWPYWANTTPTSTAFYVDNAGNASVVNGNNKEYVCYLFATLAGVSKVGGYTGTGADLNVDCGFTGGARFILIKRTDTTGGWYIYDSVRGIVSGNDPYFFLNDNVAQVTNTDYIDPLASGFTVTSSAPAGLNANGGSYIFLAIA